MAKPIPPHRTLLQPHSTFDLSSYSPTSSIQSLSLSHSQTLIYLATSSGSLFLLSTNPISFLRSVSVTDSSPIESILLLSDIGKVLLLCDGSLFLVDSLLSHPVKKLTFLKGVSAISKRIRTGEADCTDLVLPANLESSTPSQRLFNKLGGGLKANGVKSNHTVQGNNVFALVIGRKLILVELVFTDNRVGETDKEVDSLNGSLLILKEIQCIDGVKTVVWLNDSIIVGTVKGYSLYSCVTGQSGVIFTLPDVSSSPPQLKFLWKEKKVLMLVDVVGIVVDEHGQPVGGSLVFRGCPDSIGELSSCVVLVRDGKMEVYSKRSGRCIQTFTFGSEGVGPCIVANEEGGNGGLLVVATPTKVICYSKVPPEEQIKGLLRKKNFKEAISLVEELESEGEMSNEMLSFVHAQVGFLLLFDLHFEEAVNHFLQSETMQPSEVFSFIMRDPNRWSLLVPRNRYWGLHPPPAPLEEVVDDGLMAIQRAIFLRKAGVDAAVDDDFILNPPNRSELLESAIKNIIRYLEICREKELALSVREGVDTLLMYLYRALDRVDDMERLASSVNNCIVEELETLLDDSGNLRTLAFLYASKGMSSKALAIWRILARNYSSGLWEDPVLESDLHEGSKKIPSGKEIAAIEASKILEELSDQDLVLQHLGWIADINPVLAVDVLTSKKRVNQLSPDEVIAAIDPKKVEILQSYLQWLIEDQDSTDTQFHTLYALSLAKSAIESFTLESVSVNPDDQREHEANVSDLSRNSFLQSPVRERLQIFLLSSDLFDPEEVLDLIEGSELWLEKAILYRKLGQETLVLQILALKLEDCEAAEQYCAEIGRPDAYMQLLDMYLDPQNGKEPMFKAAVRLLHNHGESLDPLQVLEIVHNLSRAIDVDARLARLEERSRNVQINDESLCDSCHARLGTKLFAMYPDDTVVCYKCFRRLGESTSVKGRNFKRDILFKPGWLVTQ
ncbi:vacuolar sorting protein 3 isoform X2 [Mercurialis annua]|uniref:vacuolar sorting protein 3 isoform X2 n=1 Tax=Mercurialis annua TaxID=3986 RepID=UPI00215E14E0|nr:vacuolar sorting protein 3 isoform X2 [Mercurialis annua]